MSSPNVPTRARSSGRKRANSSVGCLAQQRQVALHAARHVEHHDEPDGLRRVVEQDDRLRLALVAHLEVVLRQRRHEPPLAVGHGDEHPHDVAAASEHRLLRTSAETLHTGRRRERRTRAIEPPDPSTVLHALALQSYHAAAVGGRLTQEASSAATGPGTVSHAHEHRTVLDRQRHAGRRSPLPAARRRACDGIGADVEPAHQAFALLGARRSVIFSPRRLHFTAVPSSSFAFIGLR